MSERDTNVSGSIAGYYYQIMLGCKELTSDNNAINSVGIEGGADVRLLMYNKDKISIEAKFHKDDMSKYSEDIVKTIYNFYNASSLDKELWFSTNVAPIPKYKKFFSLWKSGMSMQNKVKYVKECVLRGSILYNKNFRNKYKEFLSLLGLGDEEIEKKSKYLDAHHIRYYMKMLLKSKIINYSDYVFVNTKISYEKFVNKLNFSFGNFDKLSMIGELRNEIINNIKNRGIDLSLSLNDNDADKVLTVLMDKFYGCTVKNSNKKTMSDIMTMSKLNKLDLENILKNYESERLEYINNINVHQCVNILQKEELGFKNKVNRYYKGIYKNELIETYTFIEQDVINTLSNSNTYEKVLQPYMLKQFSEVSQHDVSCLFSLIEQITVLTVYNKINVNNVSVGADEEKIDNVTLENFLSYCLKHSNSWNCNDTQSAIGQLIDEFKDDPRLSDKQKFVFDLPFKNNCEPCNSKLDWALFDWSQTSENVKDFQMFQNICYRCTKCLGLYNDDTTTRTYVEMFLNCGGISNV